MRDEVVTTGDATDAVGAPSVRAETSSARSAWAEENYRVYAREVWAVLYAKTCNPELTRDAVQEAFLRLQSQQPETLRDARAWLIRVGHNWIRDQLRRAKHAARITLEGKDVAGNDREPLDTLLNVEQQELVRDGLAGMCEEDRQVLVLRYALDWSSARIAQSFDTSPTAIDMRLSRARKRLAERLREQGLAPSRESH